MDGLSNLEPLTSNLCLCAILLHSRPSVQPEIIPAVSSPEAARPFLAPSSGIQGRPSLYVIPNLFASARIARDLLFPSEGTHPQLVRWALPAHFRPDPKSGIPSGTSRPFGKWMLQISICKDERGRCRFYLGGDHEIGLSGTAEIGYRRTF